MLEAVADDAVGDVLNGFDSLNRRVSEDIFVGERVVHCDCNVAVNGCCDAVTGAVGEVGTAAAESDSQGSAAD